MSAPYKPLFSAPKPVIAMIHLEALPGTPASRLEVKSIETRALAEARRLRDLGVHGLLLENMHDTPYLRGGAGPEVVAVMAIIARQVKERSRLPCGIQILAAANTEALAVAHAAGLDFIRAEGFAFAHIADEGFVQSSAAELLRYRRRIGADRVQVWADIKKKHSAHAITADVDPGAMAKAIEFMRGDAVIVTGTVTGDPPRHSDLAAARRSCHLPVYLGSGVTSTNLPELYRAADGFIVGSDFKQGGIWSRPVDAKRVRRFLTVHARLGRGDSAPHALP